MDVFSLKRKRAVVTGGNSGIGLGIAKVFSEAGAEVIIVGRDEKKLIIAKKKIGHGCSYKCFDVTNLDQIPTFVAEIERNIGAVDILVHCAGVHLKKKAVDTSDSEFLGVLNVHLLSVFSLTREFAKRMLSRRAGSIIFISSMTAIMGMQQVVAYSTAKASIVGLMRSLVAEFARDNIRINTLAPGWIDTPMLHLAIDHDASRKQKILNRIPGGVFGKTEDIGYAALFLASEAGKYVNNVFLPIDGGAADAF